MKKMNLTFITLVLFAVNLIISGDLCAQYEEVWNYNFGSDATFVGCTNFDDDPEAEILLKKYDVPELRIINSLTGDVEKWITINCYQYNGYYIVNVDNDHKSELLIEYQNSYSGDDYYSLYAFGEIGAGENLLEINNNPKTKTYPNPFENAINLEYNILEKSSVSIVVYDGGGKILKRFEEGTRNPGTYIHLWDGTIKGGQHLPAGEYLVKFIIGAKTITSKIIKQ